MPSGYFPNGYFPGDYFDPDYFAGTTAPGGTVSGASSAGYFPHDYFAGTYFPQTYFPGSVQVSGQEYSTDIYTAIYEWFAANTDLTSQITGGMVDSQAGDLQAYPYVRTGQIQMLAKDSAEDGNASLIITGYAATSDEAKRIIVLLANYLIGVLPKGNPRPAFYFTEGGDHWQDAGCVRANDGRLSRGSRMPDGMPSWRYEEQIDFWLVKE